MSNSPKLLSPIKSPNSIFFSESSADYAFSNKRSPSPNRFYNTISIKIDPAEDFETKEHDTDINNIGNSPAPPSNSNGRGKIKGDKGNKTVKRCQGRKSRRDEHDIINQDYRRFQSRFIARSYEYDFELIRRQQGMIALQPKTGLEEIEEKRQLLRMKVENRRKAEALSTSRASTSLGMLQLEDDRGPSPYNLSSRSPSPASRILKLPNNPNDNGRKNGEFWNSQQDKKNSYDVRKKLADSTSQAVKVTKKVMNSNKKNNSTVSQQNPKSVVGGGGIVAKKGTLKNVEFTSTSSSINRQNDGISSKRSGPGISAGIEK